MPGELTTVISGSYRKHLAQLCLLRGELRKRSVDVLSPVGEGAVDPQATFIILDQDPIADYRALQDNVFAKIRRSSFLALCNVDGYIGKAAAIEIGYAIAQGLEILSLEPVVDPNIAAYTRSLSTVFGDDLAAAVKRVPAHAGAAASS